MTNTPTFGDLQVLHLRRGPTTACALRLADLAKTDTTQFAHRVDCPRCLDAMEAGR